MVWHGGRACLGRARVEYPILELSRDSSSDVSEYEAEEEDGN